MQFGLSEIYALNVMATVLDYYHRSGVTTIILCHAIKAEYIDGWKISVVCICRIAKNILTKAACWWYMYYFG